MLSYTFPIYITHLFFRCLNCPVYLFLQYPPYHASIAYFVIYQHIQYHTNKLSPSPHVSASNISRILCLYWCCLCNEIYLMPIYPLYKSSNTSLLIVLIPDAISIIPHLFYHHYHLHSSTCVYYTMIIVSHLYWCYHYTTSYSHISTVS